MSFFSLAFMAFLFAAVVLYYTVPKKFQWIVLLLASFSFYIYSSPHAVVFLVFTTVAAFLCAHILEQINIKLKDVKKDNPEKDALKKKHTRKKKAVVLLYILLTAGTLAIIKFYAYLFPPLHAFLSLFKVEFTPFILLMPLGISYYIFMSISYIIDVYRKKYDTEKNIFKLALFLSFFPQVVQGPIGRYDRLAPQLFARRNFSADNLKYGIQLFLWGLFKKLVIADRAAVIVNSVFSGYKNYGGFILFISVIFYSLQIYCDFSGGIDMATGAAQMFGIHLDKNFRRPFFATSLADFWRRWHISLGAWLKDYIFYPLVFSKPMVYINKKTRNSFGKLFPSVIATFIVYFIVGIWHGANFKYIMFGIYNGAIISLSLIFETLFLKIRAKLKTTDANVGWHIFASLRTFVLICTGRYFTRAQNFTDAMRMIKRTYFNFDINPENIKLLADLGLSQLDFIILALSVIILFGVGLMQERGFELRKTLEKKSPFIQTIALVGIMIFIIFFGIYNGSYVAVEFIYAGH